MMKPATATTRTEDTGPVVPSLAQAHERADRKLTDIPLDTVMEAHGLNVFYGDFHAVQAARTTDRTSGLARGHIEDDRFPLGLDHVVADPAEIATDVLGDGIIGVRGCQRGEVFAGLDLG